MYTSSEDEYKIKDPVDDFFLVTLALATLVLPAFVFRILVGADTAWVILDLVSSFVFGFGLFNFVITKKYLGHMVSVVSFLAGGPMMLISWLLCR